MLPATPYIFPQRPVLFPQPPTIVLVDANLQPINKSATIPIISRNTNDITKTTMVNVLPISAYSHPLSAKTKKGSAKSRNSNTKKGSKKIKSNDKKDQISDKSSETGQEIGKKVDINSDKDKSVINPDEKNDKTQETSTDKEIPAEANTSKSNPESSITNNIAVSNTIQNTHEETIDSQIKDSPKCTEPLKVQPNIEKTVSPTNKEVSLEKSESSNNSSVVEAKDNKVTAPNKSVEGEFKSKDSKIHAILDSNICENVVDVGNARLELAEEFLAASPTAAFLMSFPLVSGNRADSPAEETQNITPKETNLRNETPHEQASFFEKHNIPANKPKTPSKQQITPVTNTDKSIDHHKYENSKSIEVKTSTTVSNLVNNENPFLSLPLPSVIPSSCAITESTFGLDFDLSVNKTGTTQSTSFNSTTNNIFYKGDPFSTVKSTIYSTSNISTSHEFNSLGLYPCAMDNYASKNKTDYANVDDNLMKRLTYDIDLGWSHKSFDFVNCTTNANNFHKDNILPNTTTPFSSTYNPFNPDFHVPLVPNSAKKNPTSKSSSFPEQITSFYNQGPNLWPDDVSSIYTNSNVSKNFISKQQNYFPTDHLHTNMTTKLNANPKQFYTKHMTENANEGILKSSPIVGQNVEKYTKKSPNKMHINWMTSEIRPVQNNCNQNQTELKEATKAPYSQSDLGSKKHTQSETNYFPINMHHFPTQSNHEEHNVWPPVRAAGTTEISMEPPPINLPTLIGDLALGPHDKKKTETINRTLPHTDLQNCSNFLSVTQLMNRSSENMPLRPNGLITDIQKSIPTKQNVPHNNEVNRKARLENHPQTCYGFNESKVPHTYDSINSFSQPKTKSTKTDKNSKTQKNSYSAEALIRGGTNYSQKIPDNGAKFVVPQKYNDFNVSQDSGVAQVSHFPPIIDYSDNSYAGQQFSGTTLYNSTTNTISNSFYSNFMPGSGNLMSSNYTGGAFPSEFVDYNQTTDCNSYSNHKYSEFKMRNNITTFSHEKDPPNYKSSKRESAAKHKLECSKKESNKKYQSKRAKLGNNEVEEWNDSSHVLCQNKVQTKRHQNIVPEEIPFSNYVGNQMPAQYQPDIFNTHIMQSNMQNMGTNVDRSLSGFPVASRANFNLSALFPEITMVRIAQVFNSKLKKITSYKLSN